MRGWRGIPKAVRRDLAQPKRGRGSAPRGDQCCQARANLVNTSRRSQRRLARASTARPTPSGAGRRGAVSGASAVTTDRRDQRGQRDPARSSATPRGQHGRHEPQSGRSHHGPPRAVIPRGHRGPVRVAIPRGQHSRHEPQSAWSLRAALPRRQRSSTHRGALVVRSPGRQPIGRPHLGVPGCSNGRWFGERDWFGQMTPVDPWSLPGPGRQQRNQSVKGPQTTASTSDGQ
ncbi:hypothetical protein SAMN05421684_3831 [Asanoa ishikariensis]|uniref:Uncharacterized protein n=1 Tax=Asanoa ishikariensis TaxID=137265 RepID=A0A1H3RGX0_9ACTN|nr:hypothetical protein SAMN05421684_3831 [Asanoa ishikariensis]